jgi:ABC-type dipeptide/oligopeptide/nickel transport system ATPase component
VEEGTPQQIFSAPRNERTKQFLQSILERNAELGDDVAAFSTMPSG